MGCVEREERDIYIAKPCTHKAAGSGINGMIFESFNWIDVVYYSLTF